MAGLCEIAYDGVDLALRQGLGLFSQGHDFLLTYPSGCRSESRCHEVSSHILTLATFRGRLLPVVKSAIVLRVTEEPFSSPTTYGKLGECHSHPKASQDLHRHFISITLDIWNHIPQSWPLPRSRNPRASMFFGCWSSTSPRDFRQETSQRRCPCHRTRCHLIYPF